MDCSTETLNECNKKQLSSNFIDHPLYLSIDNLYEFIKFYSDDLIHKHAFVCYVFQQIEIVIEKLLITGQPLGIPELQLLDQCDLMWIVRSNQTNNSEVLQKMEIDRLAHKAENLASKSFNTPNSKKKRNSHSNRKS